MLSEAPRLSRLARILPAAWLGFCLAVCALRAADAGPEAPPPPPATPAGHPHVHDPQGPAGPADHGDHGPARVERLPADAPWNPPLDFASLGIIAVQEGGRKKPFDTVAIETIGTITGKALFSGNPHFKDPASGLSVPAPDLYLALWLDAREMDTVPFILVGSLGFRQELGLNIDPDKKLFSMHDINAEPCWSKLKALYGEGAGKQMRKEPLTGLEKEALDLGGRLSLIQEIQNGSQMAIVPHPTDPSGAWSNGVQAPYPAAQLGPVQQGLGELRSAYMHRNNGDFVTAAIGLGDQLRQLSPTIYPARSDLEREVHYNHLHPFRFAWLLYLVAALFMLAIFRSKNKVAYGVAVAVFGAAVLMQAYGIYLRCMISGRPPVTNMYESVVWVGGGCAGFALIFELIYRPKYYLVAGGVMAILTLILADMVPVISDAGKSIGPLVPVLRDNFWLTVHVLTITLSYAAFTLAWSLGHITLFKHLIHPETTAEHKNLHNFLYKVLMLGVLLLAIGTILGGVWANYSWGRFWGWDPKETWALIALLTYLFVLHGRFTGMWGLFGLSVGSVVCYLSVLMAWYGVNFVLGTGLHSYGFGAGGLPGVAVFCAADLLFVGAVILRRMQAAKPLTPEAANSDPAEADSAGPDQANAREAGGWHEPPPAATGSGH